MECKIVIKLQEGEDTEAFLCDKQIPAFCKKGEKYL
jgi:hypothetical protein